MTPEEIHALTQRWLSEQLEAAEDKRRSRDVGDDERNAIGMALSDVFEETHYALIGNDFTRIAPEVDELLSTNRRTVPKDSDAYRRLCRELLKAKQAVLKAEVERWEGNSQQSFHSSQNAPPPQLVPSLTLSAAVVKYLAHFQHHAPGTLSAKQAVLRRYAEVAGDRPVNAYSKQHGITYRETVGQLPAHLTKKYPGQSIVDVLALVRGKLHVPRFSKQTVNQDLTHLAHFFSWLIAEGLYSGPNPMEGLAYEGIEGESYDPFTPSDLTRIFGHPHYAASHRHDYPERYWLPLIALYSGARRGEIAGLAVADIRQEDGVWFFDITPDASRDHQLKNKASKRHVPVHSHLVALGLLRFAKEQKASGVALLFPKGKAVRGKGGEGRTSVDDAVGKWFARLLADLKVSGKKSFHSFRSTVITALHAANVDAETRRQITGHGAKDVHEAVHLQPALRTLQAVIEKLDFRPALKRLPSP